MLPKRARGLEKLAVFGLAVAVWFLVKELGLVRSSGLPHPQRVLELVPVFLTDPTFLRDLGVTVLRAAASIAVAAAVAVPIGLFFGSVRRASEALSPLVDFWRSVPATALIPLAMVFFGRSEASKIGLSAFAAGLVVYVNTAYGVANADRSRLVLAQLYQMKGWQRFVKMTLPEAVPYVVVGLRVGLSLAIVLVVVMEMIMGGEAGIGQRIYDSQVAHRRPEMVLSILCIGLIGYALNAAAIALERRLFHWRGA